MNIRRQKQIKAFLVEEFGADRGNALFHGQEKTLYTLIENEGDKSGAQRKTLAQTILPCIALYKALLQDSSLREGAHGYVQKYMLEKAAAEKHASPAKMEAVPGFYRIYSSVFLKIMRISDSSGNSELHMGSLNYMCRRKKMPLRVAVHKTGFEKQILWQLPDKGC